MMNFARLERPEGGLKYSVMDKVRVELRCSFLWRWLGGMLFDELGVERLRGVEKLK